MATGEESPVEGEEMIQPGAFDPAIEGAKILIGNLDQLEEGFKSLSDASTKWFGVTIKSLAQLEAFNAAVENLEVSEKALMDIQGKKIKLEQEIQKLEAEKTKAATANEKLSQAQIKTQKDQIDLTNKQAKATKDMSGILGQLLKQKKELQGKIFTAKTKDEIEKLNSELFKTNMQIKDIKEAGTKSFNSWGNALQSFQFKFNSLGQSLGQMAATGLLGLTSVIVEFGGKLLMGAGEWAKSMGFFGDSVKQAKENSAALAGELQKVEDRLAAIAKGVDVQFSSAFDSVIQTIDLKIAKTKETLNDFQPKLKGLTPEEKKQVTDKIKEMQDEITQLEIERAIAVEKQYRESEKNKTEAAKKENVQRVQDRIAALGQEIARAKEMQADMEFDPASSEENARKYKSRKAFLQAQIDELEDTSAKKQVERHAKVVDDKTKKDTKAAAELKEVMEKLKFNPESGDPNDDPMAIVTPRAAEVTENMIDDQLDDITRGNLEAKKKYTDFWEWFKKQSAGNEKTLAEQRAERLQQEKEYQDAITDLYFQSQRKKLGNSEEDQRKLKALNELEAISEIGLAYYNLFQKYSADPTEKNPSLRAAREVFNAKTLSKLATAGMGLYEGTEKVGEEHSVFTLRRKKDPFLVPLHPGERVMTETQNDQVGGLSNDELARAGELYRMGMLGNGSTPTSADYALLVADRIADRMVTALKNKKELHLHRNVYGELIIGEFENGIMKETTQKESPIVRNPLPWQRPN